MGASQSNYWSSEYAKRAADEVCSYLGPPRILVRERDGAAIWTEFNRARSLMGSLPSLFTKVMVLDMPHDYVYIFAPVGNLTNAQLSKLLSLPANINYNRETQELNAIGDDLYSAMVAMHTGIITLAGSAADVSATSNLSAERQSIVNLIRAMYIDMCASVPQALRDAAIKRKRMACSRNRSRGHYDSRNRSVEHYDSRNRSVEHYESYDDGGIASNNPQDIEIDRVEDSQFYNQLPRNGYPYLMDNAQSKDKSTAPITKTSSLSTANKVINSGRNPERMINQPFVDTGIRSNDPYAVAYTDDERNDFYDDLYAAENSGTARPGPQQSLGYASRDPNYRLEADAIRAQMLHASFPGPIVMTTGNPAVFAAANTSAPDVGIIGYATGIQSAQQSPYMRNNVGNREHLQTNDVRFSPENAAIYYDVGSDVNSITRTYGTVSQKIHYPDITNVLQGITHTVPPPAAPTANNLSTSFKPAATERFTNDWFTQSSVAKNAAANYGSRDIFASKLGKGRFS